jgi:hypothetical protein
MQILFVKKKFENRLNISRYLIYSKPVRLSPAGTYCVCAVSVSSVSSVSGVSLKFKLVCGAEGGVGFGAEGGVGFGAEGGVGFGAEGGAGDM